MSFYDRQYELYLILGNPSVEPAWVESTWKIISPSLDPLMRSARGQAAVRSTQLKPGSGSSDKLSISFGKIGWNEHGHKKWIHPSNDVNNAIFVSSEVWAPSWTTCKRDARAPDNYFALYNEKSAAAHVCFNPTILLAVALDQDDQLVSQGRESAEAIAHAVSSMLRVRCSRPWGYRHGDAYFTNAIGDLIVSGPFKPGLRHQEAPSTSILSGSWEVF